MSTPLISFEQLSPAMRTYLTERAGNYDYMTARDVYSELPSELLTDERHMKAYMQGNEAIDVEPHELMHHVSEANGGLDTPDNISFGPRSINRSIGGENMTSIDHDTVNTANEIAVEKILHADPDVFIDITDAAVVMQTTTETTSIAAEATEAGESLLGDALGLVAETAVAGIAAYKVGKTVHDNLPSSMSDDTKTKCTLAAGGGTALLAFTPPGQLAIGVYATYKLCKFGFKMYQRFSK